MSSSQSPSFQKTINVTSQYLYLPISNTSPKVTVQLSTAGRVVREFNLEPAFSDPADWWAYYDISQFIGQELVFKIIDGEIPDHASAWLENAIRAGNELPAMEGVYQERYRPQFHFTPRRGWNNDPNGMVYFAGEWHLFFQHNPFGIRWGNMHWGHAVSHDLVHWVELPTALYQKSLRDMAFSGGGLVDWTNSSGFQEGKHPPLVFAFTSTGRGECLAYSNDRGRTLNEWHGNPFLSHQGRDPKMIWYEAGQKWILIIYEELEDGQRGYAFYDSPDLKHWTRQSFLSGYFECPELFCLPVADLPGEQYWVIHGSLWEKSPSTCSIGHFDGGSFQVQAENFTSHYGPHFYAAQLFSDAPNNRRIMVGWLVGAEYPGMPFSQGMTVPLELSLRSTSSGMRLCYYPVKELESLRVKTISGENLPAAAANELLSRHDSELIDLELETAIDQPITVDVRGYPVRYEPAARAVTFAGKTAPLPEGENRISLRILVDRSVTEVFVNGGLAAFASMTIFADPSQPVSLSGSPAQISIQIHSLTGIW